MNPSPIFAEASSGGGLVRTAPKTGARLINAPARDSPSDSELVGSHERR